MWPDSKVDKNQEDKHQVGQTHKRRELKVSPTRFERPYRGQRTLWTDCHVARLPSELIPCRQPPRWTDSQVDRTKSEHNPDLTEPIVDTILLGETVMWPDSKVDKIQEGKHQVGKAQKGRELKVSPTRFERPYRGKITLWTDCHMGRLPSEQNPSSQTPM